MCGILGVVSRSFANQLLYDGLLVLQHRGQDAAGIVTADGNVFHMHKGSGLVRDVFRSRNMHQLFGKIGIAHCRYPTAGSINSPAEAQPLYVNSPFGIVMGHNGNLTNTEALAKELFVQDLRHVNTRSDSEVLLNVLAHEIQKVATSRQLGPKAIFDAVSGVHRRLKGAYAVVAMIAGYGLIAFRDPWGIRPLVIGERRGHGEPEYMVASESVALDSLGFRLLRDVAPGEIVFIDNNANFYNHVFEQKIKHCPCIFEYVYLARPDSVIDGISVYETRLRMGKSLATKIRDEHSDLKIDVVIPIPDSSRPSAMELSEGLGVPYREGFIKNRYIGRTFIMPGQETREKSVRQKLNAIGSEFKDKNVLLVDDSIVRGTTSKEIVQMARDSGARQVFLASASPPVCHPNVYGIDMPAAKELIAHGKNEREIANSIGADRLIYQTLEDLIEACNSVNPLIEQFETSCFNGRYITGDVTEEYLAILEAQRNDLVIQKNRSDDNQLDLNLSVSVE